MNLLMIMMMIVNLMTAHHDKDKNDNAKDDSDNEPADANDDDSELDGKSLCSA